MKPTKNANGETIKRDPTSTHIGDSKGVWKSNSFTPALLAPHKPALACELTPRAAKRAITLDRNFSKEKWLYNKNQMDDFNPDKSKKDLERSKSLKKLSKRQ